MAGEEVPIRGDSQGGPFSETLALLEERKAVAGPEEVVHIEAAIGHVHELVRMADGFARIGPSPIYGAVGPKITY